MLSPGAGTKIYLALDPSEAGIREPELTLQVLSGLGGVKGFLFVAGWTLALISGVLLAVFF
jgi:hypothetical protein